MPVFGRSGATASVGRSFPYTGLLKAEHRCGRGCSRWVVAAAGHTPAAAYSTSTTIRRQDSTQACRPGAAIPSFPPLRTILGPDTAIHREYRLPPTLIAFTSQARALLEHDPARAWEHLLARSKSARFALDLPSPPAIGTDPRVLLPAHVFKRRWFDKIAIRCYAISTLNERVLKRCQSAVIVKSLV